MATWLNACGKFPSWRLPIGLYCSASSPTSFLRLSNEQTFEEFFGFLEATLEDEVVYQPKAAREKGAFTRRETINSGVRLVAQNKSVDYKPAFNLRDGIANPIIARGQGKTRARHCPAVR